MNQRRRVRSSEARLPLLEARRFGNRATHTHSNFLARLDVHAHTHIRTRVDDTTGAPMGRRVDGKRARNGDGPPENVDQEWSRISLPRCSRLRHSRVFRKSRYVYDRLDGKGHATANVVAVCRRSARGDRCVWIAQSLRSPARPLAAQPDSVLERTALCRNVRDALRERDGQCDRHPGSARSP